jgi:hypothetical protein
MEMYVEQKLAKCHDCGRPFAVQYTLCADRLPSHVTDVTTVLSVACPQDDCHRLQRLSLLFRVCDVVVKWLPFLEPNHPPLGAVR